jgi:hypothetical protein
MSTTIKREFAGEQRPFRLRVDQLLDLERQSNCGPQELAKRLVQGTWRLNDVRMTVGLALIGGGMEKTPAEKMMVEYFDGQPLQSMADLAASIVWAALIGAESVDKLDRLDSDGDGDG